LIFLEAMRGINGRNGNFAGQGEQPRRDKGRRRPRPNWFSGTYRANEGHSAQGVFYASSCGRRFCRSWLDQQVNMAICEKTVVELYVTEICTKSNYFSELKHPIFNVYGSGLFTCIF
jgi:hypothetical protein